jgi:transposase
MKKSFSPQQKATVALLALKGLQSTSQISNTFGVHATQVNAWKKQAQESLEHAFTDKRTKEGKTNEQLIKELYQLLGQRDVELAWLKKSLAPFDT